MTSKRSTNGRGTWAYKYESNKEKIASLPEKDLRRILIYYNSMLKGKECSRLYEFLKDKKFNETISTEYLRGVAIDFRVFDFIRERGYHVANFEVIFCWAKEVDFNPAPKGLEDEDVRLVDFGDFTRVEMRSLGRIMKLIGYMQKNTSSKGRRQWEYVGEDFDNIGGVISGVFQELEAFANSKGLSIFEETYEETYEEEAEEVEEAIGFGGLI